MTKSTIDVGGVTQYLIAFANGGVSVMYTGYGFTTLADAKTAAIAYCDAQIVELGTQKTNYQAVVTALAGAPSGTHSIVDAFGDTITINEYSVSGKTYFVPESDVTGESSRWTERIANIDALVTKLGTDKTEINAL